METSTLSSKKEILAAGLKKHQAVIDDVRGRIKEMVKAECALPGSNSNPHVRSHKSETLSEVSLLSDQLQFANHEAEELKRIELYASRIHPVVEFGTVVKTDKCVFFVAAGIEWFTAAGMAIFGVSVQSPLYKSMKGKRVGETFVHGNATYTIEEII